MKIRVEAYSGHKANQRPIKFWVDDDLFFVQSIEDQWRGVDAIYFRIHAHDGKVYVLRYADSTDTWTLETSSNPR